MNIKTKETYSEVYQILDLLGKDYIDKLPIDIINMFKEEKDANYNPQYTDRIPLTEQNIKKETISIIVLLYINYWYKDENDRLNIIQTLKGNEEKYKLKLREKYNSENIFINQYKKSIIETPEINQELSLKETNKEKWYTKFWKIIKNFLKK